MDPGPDMRLDEDIFLDNPRSRRSTEDIATGHWPAARGAPIKKKRTKV